MMKIKYIFLGLVLLVVCQGCQKDVISSKTTEIAPGPIITIQSSVSGLVTDQEGNPLADVAVTYRADVIKTDENGYFKVKDAPVVFDGGLLKFEQDGFFENYKWFFPKAGDIAFVRVIMVKEQLVGSVSNTEGGTVLLNGGATVSFPAGAFDSSEENFEVYAYWYNPLSDKLTEEMPGDLRAINEDGALLQLATYGMVAVELRDNHENDIQLKDGMLATIEFPLPALLDENASKTIKTWSFDEETANWVEEGTATLVDNKYVAEVSHFSFWNCDAPFPIVHITGRLITQNGNALPNVKICISDLDRANTRSGWTSYNGVFSGKVPKETPLKLVAKDECGELLYEDELDPISDDIDLGDFVVDGENFVEVSGTLVCDGLPFTNGYALIALPNGIQFVAELDDQGNFEINLPYCELNKISIKGYNLGNNTASEWQIMEDFEPKLFIGDIEVCDGAVAPDEYIKFKMNDGTELILDSPEGRLDNGQLTIQDANDFTGAATIIMDEPKLGSVSVFRTFGWIMGQNIMGNCGGNNPSASDCQGVTCELSSYIPEIGEYIEGAFMGTISNSNLENISIMGTFRVQLDRIITESIISGYVWNDLTNDGIRDDSDLIDSLSNLSRVSLYREGELVASTNPNSIDGYYSFRAEAGTYQVGFSRPIGYVFVAEGAGSDPTIDSDVDASTGFTEEFDVDGVSPYSYDAGLFWSGEFNCDDVVITITDASCSNNNGSYNLFVDSQDSLQWEGYQLLTSGPNLESTVDFASRLSITNLPGGAYTYTISDEAENVICSQDFVIEEEVLQCELLTDMNCEGSTVYGSIIEFECETSEIVSILWDNGSAEPLIELPEPGFYSLTITDTNGCTGEFVQDFTNFPTSIIEGTVWIDSAIGNPNIYDEFFEETPANLTVNLYQDSELLDTQLTDENGFYQFLEVIDSNIQIEVVVPSEYELVPYMDPDNPNFISDSDINPETMASDIFEIINCDDRVEIMIGLKAL